MWANYACCVGIIFFMAIVGVMWRGEIRLKQQAKARSEAKEAKNEDLANFDKRYIHKWLKLYIQTTGITLESFTTMDPSQVAVMWHPHVINITRRAFEDFSNSSYDILTSDEQSKLQKMAFHEIARIALIIHSEE